MADTPGDKDDAGDTDDATGTDAVDETEDVAETEETGPGETDDVAEPAKAEDVADTDAADETEDVTETEVDEPAGDGEAEASGAGDDERAGAAGAGLDEPARRRGRRLVAVLSALVVVLVAAVATGAIFLTAVVDHREVNERRAAILAVARDVAKRSYSLSYESFPQESKAIIEKSTGKYRQGLIDITEGLQSILAKGKVKSTCTITAAGVERDDQNTATVLLSVTSRVTNTEHKSPQVRYYRVSMNLVRQGDEWLVRSNDVIA